MNVCRAKALIQMVSDNPGINAGVEETKPAG